MQQTNQYKLNLIESGDAFSATPLNENAEKTEQALEALEQAIENAKASGLQIEAGSYTGTGTYGETNQNSLTFSFKPNIVFVSQADSSSYSGFWLQGASSGRVSTTSSSVASATLSWSGNSVSWYYYNSARTQLNEDGKTYLYLALGLN